MSSSSSDRSRRHFLKANSSLLILSVFTAVARPRLVFAEPIPPGGDVGQQDWRFCNKCDGLFYDGYPQKGVCPGSGGHFAQGFNFELPFNNTNNAKGTGDTQKDWRYCGKCHGMFFAGFAGNFGTCPAGGGHNAQGYNFILHHDTATNLGSQNNWRGCGKCSGMFYDGYPTKGHCPAGGAHVAAGYNFVLSHPAELPKPNQGGSSSSIPQTQFQFCAASCDTCKANGLSCSRPDIRCANVIDAPAACLR
jgi:hypothetical protein